MSSTQYVHSSNIEADQAQTVQETPEQIMAQITATAARIRQLEQELEVERQKSKLLLAKFDQTVEDLRSMFGLPEKQVKTRKPRPVEARFMVVLKRFYNANSDTMRGKAMHDALLSIAEKTSKNIQQPIPDQVRQWIEEVSQTQAKRTSK